MKCDNCRNSISKNQPLCINCGARYQFLDVGNLGVAALVAWFVIWAVLWFGIGIALAIVMIALGAENESLLYGILIIISIIWTGFVLFLLFKNLGPGTAYTCKTCKKENPAPVYQCIRCGKLVVKKGLGNHILAISMGFLIMCGMAWIIIDLCLRSDGVACFGGLISGGVGITLLSFQVGQYKQSIIRTQERIDSGEIQSKLDQLYHERQQQYAGYGTPMGYGTAMGYGAPMDYSGIYGGTGEPSIIDDYPQYQESDYQKEIRKEE